MGRRIRIKLDLIYPSYHSQQERKGWEQLKSQGNVKQFTPTSQVLVRSYNTSNKWVSGEVTQRLGNMHYEVKVNGNINDRSINSGKYRQLITLRVRDTLCPRNNYNEQCTYCRL